ncbi:hypothetical protein HNY73_014593 [Argiope bruennichi]|uniref:Uncharacterized protein n=1 Tax=Argiope bruennichi TaxID=94029 RepID=A0A8T0EPX8_ARGBR|nr:hypothetical protein HNY73_014593 [Argiope bruennichi]
MNAMHEIREESLAICMLLPWEWTEGERVLGKRHRFNEPLKRTRGMNEHTRASGCQLRRVTATSCRINDALVPGHHTHEGCGRFQPSTGKKRDKLAHVPRVCQRGLGYTRSACTIEKNMPPAVCFLYRMLLSSSKNTSR